jgi:hypothetical protein
MPDPILTRIEDNMSTLIAGMRVSDGYNYDWLYTNQPDMAKVQYPTAIITLNPDEQCLDDITTAHAGAYSCKDTFLITVVGTLLAEKELPTFEINKIWNKTLDDLKKLFGTNFSLTVDGACACDTIQYRSARRVYKKNGDIFVPGHLETTWEITYSQDRTNPTQFA